MSALGTAFRTKQTIQQKPTESTTFSGHIKSGQAYLVAKRNQNQRKTMFQNFDFINKPICCKINILQVFEAKISTELFVSNCVLEKSEIKKVFEQEDVYLICLQQWVGGWMGIIDFPFPPHPIFHVDYTTYYLRKSKK